MDQSRVKYEISYDKTRQLVLVYPQWRGTRPNSHVIGEYTPENVRANLEDYVKDLGQTIRDALARVGQFDLAPFKVMITPLDGSHEVMAKDFDGPLTRVPLADQVPVSETTTVAMATTEEEANGTPEEIPSLVTKDVMGPVRKAAFDQRGETDRAFAKRQKDSRANADAAVTKRVAKKAAVKKAAPPQPIINRPRLVVKKVAKVVKKAAKKTIAVKKV